MSARRTQVLALLLAVMAATGCGTTGGGLDRDAGSPHATPDAAPAGGGPDRAARPPQTTRDVRPARERPRSRGHSWPTAMLLRPADLRSRPGGRLLARLRTRTRFGSPVVLAVVRRRGGWLGVLDPAAGNGRVGWIRARGTRAYRTSWSITVALRPRMATVRRSGRPVWSFPVAIGTASSPTPTGRFAVTDRLEFRPQGVYGCCALALTARQPNVPQGWGGGDRIAFHATLAAGTIGTAASHGCLRTHTKDMRRLLRHVPLGSPVTIRA